MARQRSALLRAIGSIAGSLRRRRTPRQADAPEVMRPGERGPNATRDLSAEERAMISISYDPDPDGRPDPGEIVWTWVPYVEHDGRGKDRPVLLIARLNETTTVGCYLSTKQHAGFVAIGSGAWDPRGRDSFVSLDRFLRVHDGGVRREGHVLSQERFEVVAEAARARQQAPRSDSDA